MPSHPCRHPTCPAYVADRGAYCPDHAAGATTAQDDRRERDRWYDQHHRDKAAKSFYNSAAWDRARRQKLADHPVCERCRRAWPEHVHHVKPLRECTRDEALDQGKLKALCVPCHNIEEAELWKSTDERT